MLSEFIEFILINYKERKIFIMKLDENNKWIFQFDTKIEILFFFK